MPGCLLFIVTTAFDVFFYRLIFVSLALDFLSFEYFCFDNFLHYIQCNLNFHWQNINTCYQHWTTGTLKKHQLTRFQTLFKHIDLDGMNTIKQYM